MASTRQESSSRKQANSLSGSTRLWYGANSCATRASPLLLGGYVSLTCPLSECFGDEKQVASCALPAAGALAWYLLQATSRNGFKQLDPSSRRHSIENLFVLIAHMGILHDPEDGNYQLFCQAKNALHSAMDTILNPPDTTQPENSPSMLSDWMLSDHFGFGMDSW